MSAACPVLRDWDRTAGTSSRGALLFDRFWRRAVAAVAGRPAVEGALLPRRPRPHAEHARHLGPGVLAALADAVGELRGAGVALDAPLGEHQWVRRGPERIALSGGTEALGVWNKTEGVWDASAGAYTDVSTGSSYIQAVGWDGGPCPVARTLLTYSQSSNPGSPHFGDQTELFSRGRWVTSRFCEKDILRSPALRVVRVHEGRGSSHH